MEKNFKGFYNEYFRYVYFIVAQYVPIIEDREDVISDVFSNLWKFFENIDTEKNVKSLVFTITKRKINDFLRKKYRLHDKEIIIEDFDNLEEPSKKNTKSIQNNFFVQLILQFDQKYQTLYKLKYQQNLSYSQIAQEMKITKNNAKVLHNRLIKKLKKIWTQKNNT